MYVLSLNFKLSSRIILIDSPFAFKKCLSAFIEPLCGSIKYILPSIFSAAKICPIPLFPITCTPKRELSGALLISSITLSLPSMASCKSGRPFVLPESDTRRFSHSAHFGQASPEMEMRTTSLPLSAHVSR